MERTDKPKSHLMTKVKLICKLSYHMRATRAKSFLLGACLVRELTKINSLLSTYVHLLPCNFKKKKRIPSTGRSILSEENFGYTLRDAFQTSVSSFIVGFIHLILFVLVRVQIVSN